MCNVKCAMCKVMRTMIISIFLFGTMMVTAQPQARMSSTSTMAQPQMAGDVVGMSSSSRAKKVSAVGGGGGVCLSGGGGGLSGGVSAGGLMLSGSQYAGGSSEVSNGEASVGSADAPTGPRRVNGHPTIPFPDPLGDALWPLLALASVYALLRVYRRKRSV